jgi:hypothetical protein
MNPVAVSVQPQVSQGNPKALVAMDKGSHTSRAEHSGRSCIANTRELEDSDDAIVAECFDEGLPVN